MPKAWRRSASAFGGAGSFPAPPAVHVLLVEVGPDNTSAVWTFDTDIATEGAAGGFLINGGVPGGSLGPSANTITYTLYGDTINSGDPWQMIASLCAGLTFVGGGILVDGAGSVT